MDKTLVTKKLLPKDLQTINFSIDKVCTLYFHKKKVFRAINPGFESQVKELFDTGMMQELVDNNLFIETWVSEIEIEGYQLVLEHKRIEIWNYPYEWSFNMLRDAALTVINANIIANTYGYELFDVHAYNVVFDMSTPKYIDFGSFFKVDKKNSKSWPGYLNFYNSFYIPLYLYNKGYSDLPQSILLYNGLFNKKDFFNLEYKKTTSLLGNKVSNLIFKGYDASRRLAVARYHRVIDLYGKHTHIKKLLWLKKMYQNRFTVEKANKLIKRIKTSEFDSYWKNYHTEINPKEEKRFVRIIDLINKKLPDARSLVELASNQGKFANFVLKETQIDTIIATDYDKNALDDIYVNNKNSRSILPLVYDFVRPNGRQVDTNIEERITSDVVMALAVTHHLILTQEVNVSHLFKVLKTLTNKYVIIEFMPLGLYSGDMDSIPPTPDFYTLAWFKKEFKTHFKHIFDEEVEVNRHVFVGELM